MLLVFDTAGFHEAVGDTIALSVSTPQHLEKVGLLENYTDTEEDSINALMQIALQKVLGQRDRRILHIRISAKHINISNLYTYLTLHDYYMHNNYYYPNNYNN
jgi:hypothetical protein